MYLNYLKPFLDFSMALLGFLVVLPVFLLCTFFLWIANSGHPFFLQKRPGKNERIFTIVKFRTMNNRKDEEGNLLPDAQRLTPIGKLVALPHWMRNPSIIERAERDTKL
ncbi:MAG: sugar transferase [Flavobacteriaceae bacterium]